MPPRKPKQPARKPVAKKGASKKSSPAKAPQVEKKIVSGTGVAVGVGTQQKTAAHEELEAKMARAIHQAHADGLTDPEEIRDRILAARDEHLESK